MLLEVLGALCSTRMHLVRAGLVSGALRLPSELHVPMNGMSCIFLETFFPSQTLSLR